MSISEVEAQKKSDAPQRSLNSATSLQASAIYYNSLTPEIIAQNPALKSFVEQKAKADTSKKKRKTSKNKHLTIDSRCRTLALKFYPEQMLTDEERTMITNPKTGRIDYSRWQDGDLLENVRNRVDKAIHDFEYRFNALKSKKDKHKRHWQLEAILHDKDLVANPDDMFLPSSVKPHFHLILRDCNKNLFHVSTILKALGLNYQKKDSLLFYEQGCTTVKDFNAYSVYLTHDTDASIRDGKEPYELSEVMTNMSEDELKDIRAGYARLQAKSKLSEQDWNELAEYAKKLGNELGDFRSWARKTLTFAQRTSRKFEKLREEYNIALSDTIEQSPDIIRCCILISGDQNSGKSYTSRHALQQLGETIYNARASTGKYDGLTSEATAMLFDDRKMTDSLNVSDNRATILHARGTANDRPWKGHYVVITTNLTPDEFYNEQVLSSQVEALKSRFYTCEIVTDNFGREKLELVTASYRGNAKDVEARNKLFMAFADKFNELIKNYKPNYDLPELDAKYYNNDPNQSWAPSKQADLLNENNDLREKNLALSYKLGDLISVIRSTDPYQHDNLFYVGNIDTPTSQGYEYLIQFLQNATPIALVHFEDERQARWTAEELLNELPKPNSSAKPFVLSNCEYIRIYGVSK